MIPPLLKFLLLPIVLGGHLALAIEFEGIGDLPGGSFYSAARALSKDGSYIVGESNSNLGNEGFLYDISASTIEAISDLNGGDFRISCYGVANTGRVIGYSHSTNGAEAFYRDPISATEPMGDLSGGAFWSVAYGISMNQDVSVGRSYTEAGIEAFRWTEESGMTSLNEALGSPDASAASGISPDGVFIIGTVDFSPTQGGEGFYWSEEAGIERIGKLPNDGGRDYSTPTAVTNQASTIVGESNGEAFRWTPDDGIEGLGFLESIPDAHQSHATDISADGKIVVGWSLSSIGNRKEYEETAFVWTEETGMVALEEVMIANGLADDGWILRSANGISADGTTIIGEGQNPDGSTEAFLVTGFSVENILLLTRAAIVVEQATITGANDYGTGTGQSFLLPAGETVAAIQLHISSVGSGGGSIQVRLWRATGAPGSHFTRLDPQPIASGVLDRTDVSGTPDWFTIVLDQAFTNSGKDSIYLVFEMELLTAGNSGWNNYSYSNNNSYNGGHSVYWSESQGNVYVIRDGQDLTFRILDSIPSEVSEIGRPEIYFEHITWHATYKSRVVVSLQKSDEKYFYYLRASSLLVDPQSEWEIVDGGHGRSDKEILFSEYYISVPKKRFFIISRELID